MCLQGPEPPWKYGHVQDTLSVLASRDRLTS